MRSRGPRGNPPGVTARVTVLTGEAARGRVLAEHTYARRAETVEAHRAEAVERYVNEARDPRAGGGGWSTWSVTRCPREVPGPAPARTPVVFDGATPSIATSRKAHGFVHHATGRREE